MKYYFVIISLGFGLVKCEKETLVVKGEVANIREFAHSAFFAVSCTNKNQGFICGSSIVNQKILLTAAHCVDVCFGKNKMAVTVGHSHFSKGFGHGVHSAYLHEEYRKQNFDNDIALLRLKRNLKFSVNVRRVALLKRPPYFEKAHIAGWGVVREGSEKSDILLYVDQYVWKQTKCKKLHPYLPTGSFCASSKKSNSFPSDGDSGGALTVRGYIQIGIASFKVLSSVKALTIYTDVGYHYDWIRTKSNKLYCAKQS